MGTVEGVVIRKSSRDVLVDTKEGVIRCSFRGKLRDKEKSGPTAVAGDRVLLSRTQGPEGVIERVLPRRTELVRGTGGRKPIVVAANVDRLLVVLAAVDPPPRWALVDRMLVAAERDSLEPAICFNKVDQLESGSPADAELRSNLAIYRDLGYPVFPVSARAGIGLEALRGWLEEKTAVLSGHSGVGKSTLLNALLPGLEIETGELNEVTGKGRHTTTAVSFHRLSHRDGVGNRYLADTPGFREFVPTDLKPAELGRHYPEFRSVLERGRCRYPDCLHRIEPACAIQLAVEKGSVSRLRYESYLQILGSLLDPRA